MVDAECRFRYSDTIAIGVATTLLAWVARGDYGFGKPGLFFTSAIC